MFLLQFELGPAAGQRSEAVHISQQMWRFNINNFTIQCRLKSSFYDVLAKKKVQVAGCQGTVHALVLEKDVF